MVSTMMIFVGTDLPGRKGPQFHVWVSAEATTEDLAEAIGKHQSLHPNQFILQHLSFPLLPSATLSSQGLHPYSTVHMYLLSDLRAKDQARKEEAKREAESRGRYITKDGTDRLRRRTRAALAELKARKERERRGDGLVPCYNELQRVSREFRKSREGDQAGASADTGIEEERASGSGCESEYSLNHRGANLKTDVGRRTAIEAVNDPRRGLERPRGKRLLTSRPLKLDKRSATYPNLNTFPPHFHYQSRSACVPCMPEIHSRSSTSLQSASIYARQQTSMSSRTSESSTSAATATSTLTSKSAWAPASITDTDIRTTSTSTSTSTSSATVTNILTSHGTWGHRKGSGGTTTPIGTLTSLSRLALDMPSSSRLHVLPAYPPPLLDQITLKDPSFSPWHPLREDTPPLPQYPYPHT